MAPNIGFVVLPLKQTRGHLSMPRRRRRRPARRPAAARSDNGTGRTWLLLRRYMCVYRPAAAHWHACTTAQ